MQVNFLFRVPGKLVWQAIYFACVKFFFKRSLRDQLSHVLLVWFSLFFLPNSRYLFVDDRFGPLCPIPQKLPKLAKWPSFGRLAFPNRLEYGSPDSKKIQWNYFCYVVCKFNNDRSSNTKDNESNNCIFGPHSKNGRIPRNISENIVSIFTRFLILVDICGDY